MFTCEMCVCVCVCVCICERQKQRACEKKKERESEKKERGRERECERPVGNKPTQVFGVSTKGRLKAKTQLHGDVISVS